MITESCPRVRGRLRCHCIIRSPPISTTRARVKHRHHNRETTKRRRERERENFFPKPNDEMVRVGGRRRCQTPVRRDVVRTAVLLFVRGLERSSRNISVTASKNEKENAIKWRPFSPSRQARAAFSPRICIYFLFYISVFPGYSFLYKAVMNGHWLEGCRY